MHKVYGERGETGETRARNRWWCFLGPTFGLCWAASKGLPRVNAEEGHNGPIHRRMPLQSGQHACTARRPSLCGRRKRTPQPLALSVPRGGSGASATSLGTGLMPGGFLPTWPMAFSSHVNRNTTADGPHPALHCGSGLGSTFMNPSCLSASLMLNHCHLLWPGEGPPFSKLPSLPIPP